MTAMTLAEPAQDARTERHAEGVITPWRIFALVAGLLFAASSVRPLGDVDLYWHLVLGKEMVAERTISGLGATWSFQAPNREWITTQWLSELIFFWLHDLFSWQGIAGLRVLVALLFAMILAKHLLGACRSPWAAIVYLCVLVGTFPVLQERPQLFSLLLLVWLASVVNSLLTRGVAPPAWVVLLLTALWANLHGLWILAPACLGLLLVGYLLDRDFDRARLVALLTGTALVGGCLTPVGPKLLISPLRFAAATAHVSEWQPTSFRNLVGVTFVLLLTAAVFAWARSRQPVPLVELVYIGGVAAFALLAMRNLPPAIILVAPVVLARVTAAYPWPDAAGGERERRALAVGALLLATAGCLGVAGRVASVSPLPDTLPIALAETVAREEGDHRVLNDYNVGGVLLLWGGPRTRVAIDGRADYYGPAYVADHLDLLALRGDWRETLRRSRANYALLRQETPLVLELRRRGWRELQQESDFVLLASAEP